MSFQRTWRALKGLSRLKALHLPGPIWNRNADGGKQLSRELGHLSGIHTLQKLTFSYHFLDNIRFKDEGLEAIGELTACGSWFFGRPQ